jgi:dTDP-4-amino-4,6-dideoxygalactose transaminase
MSTLALHGGEKTVTAPAPHYSWPVITDAVEHAVVRQLHKTISIYNRSDIFERFENTFLSHYGRKHALLMSSGTAAIHSMYVGAGICPNDEVICPAYTFYATVTPLFQIGAIPVLCDCTPSGNLDFKKLPALLTKKTRAVVVTHMWGIPADMDEIVAFCKKHSLMLFEDCSHAHGATYHGQLVGTFGDAAAFSLQGQKIITGGEGGILITNSDELYYRSMLFGHYNKRCVQEIPKTHPLYLYAMTGMGLKLRAHPLAVAIVEEQFSHLDEFLVQKRIFVRYLQKTLRDVPGIRMPVIPKDSEPSWYAFVVQYVPEELENLPVKSFLAALQAEGCLEADMPGSTCPLNLLPLFQKPGILYPKHAGKVAYRVGDFPQAEHFFANAIKFPVWANTGDQEIVEQYVRAIKKVIKQYKDLLT